MQFQIVSVLPTRHEDCLLLNQDISHHERGLMIGSCHVLFFPHWNFESRILAAGLIPGS